MRWVEDLSKRVEFLEHAVYRSATIAKVVQAEEGGLFEPEAPWAPWAPTEAPEMALSLEAALVPEMAFSLEVLKPGVDTACPPPPPKRRAYATRAPTPNWAVELEFGGIPGDPMDLFALE